VRRGGGAVVTWLPGLALLCQRQGQGPGPLSQSWAAKSLYLDLSIDSYGGAAALPLAPRRRTGLTLCPAACEYGATLRHGNAAHPTLSPPQKKQSPSSHVSPNNAYYFLSPGRHGKRKGGKVKRAREGGEEGEGAVKCEHPFWLRGSGPPMTGARPGATVGPGS
jgi:hypothetical protein